MVRSPVPSPRDNKERNDDQELRGQATGNFGRVPTTTSIDSHDRKSVNDRDHAHIANAASR